MSSSLSESERKVALAELTKNRTRQAKEEIKHTVMYELVPKVALSSGVGFKMDLALGVNRRRILVDALREAADDLEKTFDLMKSDGKIQRKGDKPDGT